MPYRLKRTETVQQGLHHIGGEQIDRALGEITGSSLPPEEKIHQVRKRGKKVRGLPRLVRPSLDHDACCNGNAWFQDTARRLARPRDADALVATHDELLDDYAGHTDERTSKV